MPKSAKHVTVPEDNKSHKGWAANPLFPSTPPRPSQRREEQHREQAEHGNMVQNTSNAGPGEGGGLTPPPSLRAKRSNPASFAVTESWIASSLSLLARRVAKGRTHPAAAPSA
jgi:hypothetical protein